MRVKIGEQILDLPVGVDVNSADGNEPDGLVRVRDIRGVTGNRLYCQRKDRVPLDYGSRAIFSMRDRPAKGDYILGEILPYPSQNTHTLLARRRSQGPQFNNDSDYLADYRRAGEATFAGTLPYQTDPKRGTIFRFTFGTRQSSSVCQLWPNDPDAAPAGGSKPYSCIPGWSFLMGNMIVAIDARLEGEARGAIAPPDTWPRKWVQVLNEIASYRVHPKGDARP